MQFSRRRGIIGVILAPMVVDEYVRPATDGTYSSRHLQRRVREYKKGRKG